MLNRLYIVIGVLAIMVLGAGFVVPRLIDWSQYRDRLETLAAVNLGTDVAIGGEIDLALLPQPRVGFGRTIVGPPDKPFLEIGNIVADFSLMDFLRDRLSVTQLVLEAPQINLNIDKNGKFNIPFAFPKTLGASKISVASAQIKAGMISLSDARTGQSFKIDQFEGSLRVSNLRGPFGLQGVGMFDGRPMEVKLNTSAMNEAGGMQVSLLIRPQDGAYSFSGEGLFSASSNPGFKGKVTYRAAPVGADEAERVRGDLVITSEAEFSAQKLLLSSFSIKPDENRASTRLSGAAVIKLGANPEFDVVISGGVLSMAPPDMRKNQQETPYALVQLLNEIPAPYVPLMPGRIGVDIAELDLRSFALRKVRIDATSDGKSWKLADFTGILAGNSRLTLTGTVSGVNEKLAYDGVIKLETSRLDALARLWRREDKRNLLFNRDASIAADITLENGKIGVANGKFTLEDVVHDFAAQLQLAGKRNALISARFKTLSRDQSQALSALLPDFSGDGRFKATFASGSLDVAAESASLFDLAGKNLALQMDWGENGIKIVRASAQDLGGARLSFAGDFSGTLAKPTISGNGRISLSAVARTGFAEKLLSAAGADKILQDAVVGALPLAATFKLAAPDENGGQELSATGRAGVADFKVSVGVKDNIGNFIQAPLVINASISSELPDALNKQLGLGPNSLLASNGPVSITVIGQGTLLNSLATTLVAQSGDDRVGFAGTLILSDLSRLRGRGLLDFSLSDPYPLLQLAGMDGIHLGAVEGTGEINFTGSQTLSLQNIVANAKGASGAPVAGQLVMSENGDSRLVTGQLDVGALDVSQLLALVGGPTALVAGDGVWPEGPVDLGSLVRSTRGRVELTTPAISAFGRVLISDAGFELSWDASRITLANIAGSNGAGSVSGSVEFCCSALAEQKQLSARMSLNGVPLENILPDAIKSDLKGTLDAGVRIEASGASVARMMKTLSGEGSFAIKGFEVARFDPEVFNALAGVKDIAEMDKGALSSLVSQALGQGNFKAADFSGVFQLAQGAARAENLAAEGVDARLLGNLGVDFSDLSISGKWSLSPTQMDNHIGLVNQSTAQVSAILTGNLNAPKRQLELGAMIDAIQARALEIELARLERVRAEEMQRSAQAAAQRAEAMARDARIKAEEALRKAAEEEAHKIAKGETIPVDSDPQNPAPTDLAPIEPRTTELAPTELAPTELLPTDQGPAATDLLGGQ
ncbi:hypothetical protein MNBD_ALPHA12-2336 [hydrothermal vent metagenome]|uniref:AsmA domain-containing protein n=1 Tax=hydrothermal vent metagenome TaxID=652676 RepID=A0A3B0TXF4_9ZZZZ